MPRRLPIRLLPLVLLAFNHIGFVGAQTNPPGGKTSDSKKAGSTNHTTYSPKDVIAQQVTAAQLTLNFPLSLKGCDTYKNVAEIFDNFTDNQNNGQCLLQLVINPTINPYKELLVNHNAIIIHAVTWNSDNAYQPLQGAWAFYRADKNGNLTQDYDLSGNPYLYNAPHVYLVDLNYFDQGFDDSKATFGYQITTSARQKQNESDLVTLASATLKLTPSTTANAYIVPQTGTPPLPPYEVWGTITSIKASAPVPYDLAVTVTLTAKGKIGTAQGSDTAEQRTVAHVHGSDTAEQDTAAPPQGSDMVVACNPSPCSFSKTVTHYDPEYWDVSLGVSVPGVLEPKYTSTGALTTPTRHTDAYAFIDIYAFQYFANAPTSLTSIPHFNVGIPISSQSLHRPYVGLGENVGFLTKQIKLNIPISVFAGPVFLKQQVHMRAVPGLRWDHATKMMYGLELPISAVTKYMKGGSSGSNNSKSPNPSNSSGG